MSKRKAPEDLPSSDLQLDFKRLRTADPTFRQIYDESDGKLNFKDPATCIALTNATLKEHFDLQLELPDDRLCPPIPNRWAYVTWIQELIDSTTPNYLKEFGKEGDNDEKEERRITGLDIGTGASAIYALLFLKSRPSWKMCATEIDNKSCYYAHKNLALNDLHTRTTLLHTAESTPLIPLEGLDRDRLDFTVCNPPFFDTEEEMRASLAGDGKDAAPNSVCTGSANEMVCEGGDLAFVSKMVRESLELREKVRWYSAMLGKKSSVAGIVALLKEDKVNNWAVGVLAPGGSTKRWVVAWSFGDLRPRNNIARGEGITRDLLPFPTQIRIPLSSAASIPTATTALCTLIKSFDLSWHWDPQTNTGIAEAIENVWSRAYRRNRKTEDAMGFSCAKLRAKWAFRICVREEPEKPLVVLVEWLKGPDVVVWESFFGMVRRRMREFQ